MEKKFGHWEVTENGIEWDGQKNGHYHIEANRILELGPGNEKKYYEWLLHIPRKTWLNRQDILELNQAFLYAAEVLGLEVDERILKITLEVQQLIIQNKADDDEIIL